MDLVGLAMSVIEMGLKVKESIDELAQRRSRAKELASDILVDLLRIAGFCERNKSPLSAAALRPLCDSLDALNRDLHRFHKRCKAYEPKQGDAKFKRLASAFKLWMDSDEIEQSLVRIRERIQNSMNFIVSPYEFDDIDVQYIRLKSMKLADTVSGAIVTSGTTFTLIDSHYSVLGEPALQNAISTIADLQARANTAKLPIVRLFEGIVFLAQMFDSLGAMDIIQNILRTAENCIRRSLRLGTHRLQLPYHINEEAEDDFDLLEAIICYRNLYAMDYVCGESVACRISDEDVKYACEGVQFSRSRLERRMSPSNHHRMSFLHSLMPSIRYHAIRGQIEECFSYCSEALEVIQACGVAAAHEITNIIDAGVLQSQVEVLHYLSVAQVRACDYTSAYHTGMNCITSINALSDIRESLLPDDFEYFPYLLEYSQQELPTRTSIVRNPEHRTSYTSSTTMMQILDSQDGLNEGLRSG
ncbi:hypothetical protein ONZ45_g10566 [Pleurotus djamor]|nr:hypothetical protein ONZ45_g10566 [Pleurotus djamor]